MLLYGGSVNIQPIYYYALHWLKALVSFGPVITEVKYLFVSKSWLLEKGTSEVLNQSEIDLHTCALLLGTAEVLFHRNAELATG